MPNISVKNLTVNYINNDNNVINALSDFTVEFKSDTINVILGESGCGKTTLLRAICKQFEFDGDIYFDDVNTSKLDIKNINVSYVDQKLFLFNHLIVYDILTFPLKQKRIKSVLIDKKVKEIAELCGLTTLLTRKPDQLSIGQRQRVSIAKAIIKDPNILLMDEPFSNLSEQDKNEMISILKSLVEEKQITVIYVTHNLEEALLFGDNIYIINKNKVEFKGSANDILKNSSNEYINYLKKVIGYEHNK